MLPPAIDPKHTRAASFESKKEEPIERDSYRADSSHDEPELAETAGMFGATISVLMHTITNSSIHDADTGKQTQPLEYTDEVLHVPFESKTEEPIKRDSDRADGSSDMDDVVT